MSVYEAEALVLRQYSLSDSDRIIVFITREYGKIRAVARGIKKTKSRMAGHLEPLNRIRLEFWAREGRELSQVRHAELIHSYLGKNPSLLQVYAFTYFSEIANEFVQDNQANPPLYRLLLSSLDAGERYPIRHSLIRYFEIWSLKLSGLLPNYAYCSDCGKCVKDKGFFAWPESGQAKCVVCAKQRGLRIGASAASDLEAMTRLSPAQFALRPFKKETGLEIEGLTQRLFGLHLEKELKSYGILREALQNL
jgi:DNA repair protein RecO (recombination protein O)